MKKFLIGLCLLFFFAFQVQIQKKGCHKSGIKVTFNIGVAKGSAGYNYESPACKSDSKAPDSKRLPASPASPNRLEE